MRFEFATASRIIFGAGTVREVAPLAGNMGKRVLYVTGSKSINRVQSLYDSLKKSGLSAVTFSVSGEPTIDIVTDGVYRARDFACDLVIGIGGGSVIDTAKAISALLTNSGYVLDYLEVIGLGRPLTAPPAPCIAIPTTSGTGAEVTRNAVLASPEHSVKVSLRSPLMLPDLAVVDPELAYSLPPSITASSGLDALTQVLEPFVSITANPLTDAICREGMTRAARSLRRCYEDGGDTSAREDMALASLFGGLALANAKLGAVHGFAGPIGGMFSIPHGVVCAIILPFVMEANINALRKKQDWSLFGRYEEIARILTGKSDAAAEEGIDWLKALSQVLNIPRLSAYGISSNYFLEIIAKSRESSSMKGNPVVLTEAALEGILCKAI